MQQWGVGITCSDLSDPLTSITFMTLCCSCNEKKNLTGWTRKWERLNCIGNNVGWGTSDPSLKFKVKSFLFRDEHKFCSLLFFFLFWSFNNETCDSLSQGRTVGGILPCKFLLTHTPGVTFSGFEICHCHIGFEWMGGGGIKERHKGCGYHANWNLCKLKLTCLMHIQ